MTKLLTLAVFALIIGLLCFWSHTRNATWGDDLTFWEDCAAKSPNKTRVLVNFAFAYKRAAERGTMDAQEAEDHGVHILARAFEIDPTLPQFFDASKYANERGGRLITEVGMWESIRTVDGKREYKPIRVEEGK